MDAAIARKAEEQMTSGGRKLTSTQWNELVQASRAAKESLLAPDAPESFHLSVGAEGGRLIGASMSAKLLREDVERIVLEGFFPRCGPDELPRRATRVALQEFGLPYAQDPAITRQLAGFLHAHAGAGRPDAILLNGGVFNSAAIASRASSKRFPVGGRKAAILTTGFGCSSTTRWNLPSRGAPHGTESFVVEWDIASAAAQPILFMSAWKPNAATKQRRSA